MKMCGHCGKPIRYNENLQRYDHVDTNYDGCKIGFFRPGIGPSFDGQRAEPMK